MKKIRYILVFIALCAILSLPLFIKVKVECRSQYGGCPSEIESLVGKNSGKNIYAAENSIKIALKQNLLVSDFSIQFKLPDILSVNIILIKPSFAVVDRASGRAGLVDISGKILSIVDGSSLPKIITDANLQMGERVDSKTLFALNLIGGVYEMYQIGQGEIHDDSLVVELPPGSM